jgi:hypothetical protein
MIPLSVPRVRVTSILTCPNVSCMRTIYTPTIRSGEAWMKCNLGEKSRRGACPAHWLNITMAPGATGWTLAGIVGETMAFSLIGTLIPPPWNVPAERVMALPLASEPSKPVHVQIASRARDEHHLRYAPIGEVLRALQLISVSSK